MMSTPTVVTWASRIAGVLAAGIALDLMNPSQRGRVEPDYGAAGYVVLLLLFSIVAGLLGSLVVLVRLFRIGRFPRLYRRAVYVFIAGNIALLLGGWWHDAFEHRSNVYLVFGVPLVLAAVILPFGALLRRKDDQVTDRHRPTDRHAEDLQ